ncbi:hypothetical protein EDM53_01490 [Rickettsiales endosymbiont of Peranema trichophorum]|uniref:ankyrin repeat domain-containing protein n=1 Tax=Rickettsiales endosymbiont of Peranema trichophorum TaxID=2486577 RepID=UPI00102356B0|nr:ankyrin repeat domain-containing protein [Rickettsiales endosymbiont of Peranema trichophorum]RZI47546.1 hypothetical protein EDM53_01490 [Rickettsiales endosymbiont of Peranema trichophorum]
MAIKHSFEQYLKMLSSGNQRLIDPVMQKIQEMTIREQIGAYVKMLNSESQEVVALAVQGILGVAEIKGQLVGGGMLGVQWFLLLHEKADHVYSRIAVKIDQDVYTQYSGFSSSMEAMRIAEEATPIDTTLRLSGPGLKKAIGKKIAPTPYILLKTNLLYFLALRQLDIPAASVAKEAAHLLRNLDKDSFVQQHTILHLAIEYRLQSLLEVLRDHKVFSNSVNLDGHTPLTSAIKVGDSTTVEYLTSHSSMSPEIINNSDTAKSTPPLLFAVMLGNIDIINILISHRADPNKPAMNVTPLELAIVTLKSDDILTLLVRSGAKIPIFSNGISVQEAVKVLQEQCSMPIAPEDYTERIDKIYNLLFAAYHLKQLESHLALQESAAPVLPIPEQSRVSTPAIPKKTGKSKNKKPSKKAYKIQQHDDDNEESATTSQEPQTTSAADKASVPDIFASQVLDETSTDVVQAPEATTAIAPPIAALPGTTPLQLPHIQYTEATQKLLHNALEFFKRAVVKDTADGHLEMTFTEALLSYLTSKTDTEKQAALDQFDALQKIDGMDCVIIEISNLLNEDKRVADAKQLVLNLVQDPKLLHQYFHAQASQTSAYVNKVLLGTQEQQWHLNYQEVKVLIKATQDGVYQIHSTMKDKWYIYIPDEALRAELSINPEHLRWIKQDSKGDNGMKYFHYTIYYKQCTTDLRPSTNIIYENEAGDKLLILERNNHEGVQGQQAKIQKVQTVKAFKQDIVQCYACHDAQYDNHILSNPKILKKALEIGGDELLDKLSSLTQDESHALLLKIQATSQSEEALSEILEELNAQGSHTEVVETQANLYSTLDALFNYVTRAFQNIAPRPILHLFDNEGAELRYYIETTEAKIQEILDHPEKETDTSADVLNQLLQIHGILLQHSSNQAPIYMPQPPGDDGDGGNGGVYDGSGPHDQGDYLGGMFSGGFGNNTGY